MREHNCEHAVTKEHEHTFPSTVVIRSQLILYRRLGFILPVSCLNVRSSHSQRKTNAMRWV